METEGTDRSDIPVAGRDDWTGALVRPARILLAVVMICLAGLAGYKTTFDGEVENILYSTRHRLDLYEASLEREIEKYATFPYVMSYDDNIRAVTAAPQDQGTIFNANLYLERLNGKIGTLAVFVLDKAGRCIASSNWNRPDSFIGRDLSYRPYYRNVGIDHVERFYGIGTTNNEPGYFLATAMHAGSEMTGVTVVKVGLEQLERSWASGEAPALLADEHGVIVLSSVPAWKYATLRALSSSERLVIAEAQQYNGRALGPIGMTVERALTDEARIVRLDKALAPGAPQGLFLAETRPMPGTPWEMTVFSDLGEAVGLAQSRAALAALAALLVIGVIATTLQRRRSVRELVAARAALQLAHDDLERTVSVRTSDLLVANVRLQEEVEERTRAEATLREAQAGLVQAGKLAVLGQLSAGIAHELNQPLAALATLSGNTVKFLDRGDTTTVRTNLERIRPLVDRMGRLTGELKTFARKSSGEAQAVPLRRTFDNALFLLHHRIERGPVSLIEEIDEAAVAHCDPNRLEQVMLNLIGNALDALEGRPDRRLWLEARREGNKIHVEVRDNGPGLPDELLQHLFQPFYTTKAPGVGLGLGLSISAGIIRDFGGELTAANGAEGGAAFRITLPADREGTP